MQPKSSRSIEHGSVLAAATVLSALGLWFLLAFSAPAAEMVQTSGPKRSSSTRGSATLEVAGRRAAAAKAFLDSSHTGEAAYARGDLVMAEQRFRESVQRNADDAQSLNNLGQVLVRSGRSREAIFYLERAATLYPKVWEYRFNLARAYSQLEDWPRAVSEYETALTLFPDDYATLYNLGLALHRHGREDAAVARYREAIELAPGEPNSYLALGISYERLDRPGDAADAYRRYLELAPSAPEADEVRRQIDALNPASAAIQMAAPSQRQS